MNRRIKIRIFITGVYRAGTTLVTRILHNHPELCITFDSVHFMRFSYRSYDPVGVLNNAERLLKDSNYRIKRRCGIEFDINKAVGCVKKLRKIEYNNVYDIMMADLMDRYKPEAIGWGEKTNVCWGQIPNFLSMFPSGKTIHVIRDPRDVMCSYREMTYEPGYRYLDSIFCSHNSLAKAREYLKTLNPNNYYLLKYEDLLRDPIGETKKLCFFIGIKFKKEILTVNKFTDNNGKQPWSGNSSFGKKMNDISTAPIGRWKSKASKAEIYLADLINIEYMKYFGYQLSGVDVDRRVWNKIFDIIHKDSLLRERYRHWLGTGEGVEGYPSDPLVK